MTFGQNSILEVFSAAVLRGRFMYPDLSKVELTPAQKRHFIEEIEPNSDVSQRKLCERYNLSRTTVRSWRQAIEKTGFLHCGKGRPGAFDAEAIEGFVSELGKRKAEKKPSDEDEMTDLLNEHAKATSDRQGRVAEAPCPTTTRMIKHSINAVAKIPQTVSKARFAAGSDPRMAFTMWCMVKACSSNLPGQQIFNWDPTTFTVSEKGKGKLVYSIAVMGDKTPLSIVGDESLDMGIKRVHMGSVTSVALPLIFLIAIDEQGAEDFEVFEVPGLTYFSSPETVGYLCFCKTRAGNAKFIEWFLISIVIGSIKSSALFFKLNKASFVTCDGEPLFLEETCSQAVQTQLAASNIQLGKLPASCSGILQASDVSPLFRAAKKTLKSKLRKSFGGDNPVVEEAIMICLQQLEERYSISVGSTHKHKIAHGSIAVANALQDVVRPRLIAQGFADSGQYPLDFTRLMKQCYSEITPALMATMLEATDACVAYFLEHGHVSEEQMTQSGIPIFDADRGVPRDQAVLHHQRAVLLTHAATRERRENYVNCDLPLGNLITDAAQPKEDRTQNKKDAKLIGNLAKREAKKEEEKKRVAGLTADEKAAEKQEKAERAAAKREAKIVEVAEAKARLGLA